MRDRYSDRDLDEVLAMALRGGVMLAAAIVVLGAAIYLIRHGFELPDYRAFRGEPVALRSPGRIWATARTFTGRGVIQFGLLVLISTPIARVLLSVIGFVRERDWMYVLVTAIVFALLTYSLVAG
jgi:uncharacterized membrane protein